MMKQILAKAYLWFLLALLYSPILIIMIFSFTEAKVLGNWTGFSTKLYSSENGCLAYVCKNIFYRASCNFAVLCHNHFNRV